MSLITLISLTSFDFCAYAFFSLALKSMSAILFTILYIYLEYFSFSSLTFLPTTKIPLGLGRLLFFFEMVFYKCLVVSFIPSSIPRGFNSTKITIQILNDFSNRNLYQHEAFKCYSLPIYMPSTSITSIHSGIFFPL